MSKRIQIVDTIIEKNNKIVMLKRSFFPKGKLDLLGGYVEKGEGLKLAAIREAKEESGFSVELLEKLGQYDYFDRGEKAMHVYLGKIIGGKLESSEEGTPFWATLDKIKKEDLAFPQVHIRVLRDFKKHMNL